jgi:hypothetical protein
MMIRAEHELHGRRRSRNVGVGVTLVCFVALMFALSVVKVTSLGGPVEGFDHVVRPALVEGNE